MEILETNILYKAPFIDVVEITYKVHDGSPKKWYGIVRNNASRIVIIVAVTCEQELILVRQPRPMVGKYTIEFPAGLCDVPGESLLETAARELLEETGYKVSDCEVMGDDQGFIASPGITDERLFMIAAENAIKVKEPEDNEQTEPILVDIGKFDEWFMENFKSEEIDFKVLGTVQLFRCWQRERREER